MEHPISPPRTVPVLNAWVLCRDGVPVFSSTEFEYVTARMIQRIVGDGITTAVLEDLKYHRVNPASLMAVFKVAHPELMEEYTIHEVYSD